MPIGDDPDFDVGSSDWHIDSRIDDLMAEFGYSSWEDILGDIDDLDPATLRAGGYDTAEEALLAFADTNVFDFVELFYDGETDTWYVAVVYE